MFGISSFSKCLCSQQPLGGFDFEEITGTYSSLTLQQVDISKLQLQFHQLHLEVRQNFKYKCGELCRHFLYVSHLLTLLKGCSCFLFGNGVHLESVCSRLHAKVHCIVGGFSGTTHYLAFFGTWHLFSQLVHFFCAIYINFKDCGLHEVRIFILWNYFYFSTDNSIHSVIRHHKFLPYSKCVEMCSTFLHELI